MNLRKICNEKDFLYFVTALLLRKEIVSSSLLYKFDFNDNEVKKWFEIYYHTITNKFKIIKFPKIYTSFIAMYILYLSQKDNTKIIIIQKDKELSKFLLGFYNRFLAFEEIEGSNVISFTLNKIIFSNNSEISCLKQNTYNIKNISNIDLVYFAEGEIENTEKLIFDLNAIDFGSNKIKKTILAISNDLKLDYIKKI